MVKQRNIFSARIDVLTDEVKQPEVLNPRVLIAAHNEGVKVVGICKSRRKGYSDLPLFFEDNQGKLF